MKTDLGILKTIFPFFCVASKGIFPWGSWRESPGKCGVSPKTVPLGISYFTTSPQSASILLSKLPLMCSQRFMAPMLSNSDKQISAARSLWVYLLLQISGWLFAFQTHFCDGYKKSHSFSVYPAVAGFHNGGDSRPELYIELLKSEVLSCFSSWTVLFLEDMTVQQNPGESVLILQFGVFRASTL